MSARTSVRVKPRATPKWSFFGRLLDPIDQLSEAIYSILILLTFTLAYRMIRLGGAEDSSLTDEYANSLLIAAFGATVAWGIIDGIMHVLVSVLERGESYRFLRKIQAAGTEQGGVEVIAEEVDYLLEPITSSGERQMLYRSVLPHLREGRPRKIGVKLEDFAGALGCVVVAVIAVLPSLVPFLLLRGNYYLAIRLSNVVSFIMLFVAGYFWGAYTGSSPVKTGLLLVMAGVLMMLVAIPLGG
ncbi:MAG: hypothetical protein IT329_08270 [Caldilineaceae bacterium]|nr:hypothetical protein [Caldilineaceae bacterium]